jgi:hypothetical protein
MKKYDVQRAIAELDGETNKLRADLVKLDTRLTALEHHPGEQQTTTLPRVGETWRTKRRPETNVSGFATGTVYIYFVTDPYVFGAWHGDSSDKGTPNGWSHRDFLRIFEPIPKFVSHVEGAGDLVFKAERLSGRQTETKTGQTNSVTVKGPEIEVGHLWFARHTPSVVRVTALECPRGADQWQAKHWEVHFVSVPGSSASWLAVPDFLKTFRRGDQ